MKKSTVFVIFLMFVFVVAEGVFAEGTYSGEAVKESVRAGSHARKYSKFHCCISDRALKKRNQQSTENRGDIYMKKALVFLVAVFCVVALRCRRVQAAGPERKHILYPSR